MEPKTNSYLQSQVISHCVWKQVIPAPPLQQLVEEGKKFRIVHYSPTDFNNFNVVELVTLHDDMFHLREEIMEVVDDKSLKLKSDPFIGEIILAPSPNHDNEYHRGIIEKIYFAPVDSWKIDFHPLDSYAMVYFFDVGGYSKVKFKDLKPVTKPIMEFPALSYNLTLYTLEKSSEDGENIPFKDERLILAKNYQKFMNKLKKTDLLLDLNIVVFRLPMYHATDLFNIYPVSITCLLKGFRGLKTPPYLLTNKLNELKVWEWEKTVNRSRKKKWDDNAIIKYGTFGSVESLISSYELNFGTEFTCEVVRVLPSKVSEKTLGELFGEICVILLDDQMYMNYSSVLQNQMERYSNLVAKSKFNPSIKQLFMFKLDKKPEYLKKGIRQLDKWCRAIKLDADWIYLLDWDIHIPLKGLDSDDYDVRPLYGEFLRVPGLSVHICPLRNDLPIPFDETVKLFTLGKRFKFRMSHSHPDNGVHEAEYLGSADNGDNSTEPQLPDVVSLSATNNETSSTSIVTTANISTSSESTTTTTSVSSSTTSTTTSSSSN